MNKITVPFFSVAVIFIFLTSTLILPAKKPLNPPKVQAAQVLPSIGSLKNLRDLIKSNSNYYSGIYRRDSIGVVPEGMAIAPAPTKAVESAASDESKAAGSYSTTNVQVQGVDEADIVKTDGQYIYQVNNRQIVIARAYPAEDMKLVSTLQFTDESFTPLELYVDDKRLIVIGNTFLQESMVKAVIYDISDRANIKKLRETEVTGNYVSSRKIGSALYLAANKYIDYYRIMDEQNEPPLPAYRDTADKGNPGFKSISYPDIRYFPDFPEPNYLLVAGLDLDRPEQKMTVNTYLGAGQNIYASTENLYVTVTQYQAPGAGTEIYKFALSGGQAEYKGKGQVPGTVLNQFSLDENNGYFRIATTKRNAGFWAEQKPENNVYVLDNTLKITGRLENIAPGESIYSVRFMGDRAYMVTFKKVDPLFVLDLKDPKAPKILGALKIPGYSDYLHPYDENHIIGFGKDAVEAAPESRPAIGSNVAFYQEMKIALFDVSDVTHPVEKFKEVIGDRGTDSELLRNHKALLFDRNKNLLAFPVTVMEIKNKNDTDVTRYGEFAFQGAYVYNLDLTGGFRLKGRITHLEFNDYPNPGYGWYNGDKNVERLLYIDDSLYTLSKGMIKANDLQTLQEKNVLKLIF